MTIGFILDDSLDKSDGVQQAVLSIGAELSARNHEVHYIVMNTERTDIKNVHSMGEFFSVKFNGNSVRTPKPVSVKNIKKLFRDIEFDVLHVQMPYSPFFASKVLKHALPSTKKIGTFHILPYGIYSKVGTKILGYTLKKSLKSLDECFAVSEPSLAFMYSHLGISGSVLPNPIDYIFYNSFRKRKLEKVNIVFVGRFEERKGVRELINAYISLSDVVKSETTLTMIGSGPLHSEIVKQAEKNNTQVNFTGYVEQNEKAQFLADADIAIFPSKSGESFGIVLTEAMSAGAGVTIGGNNPGYRSVLSDWPETLFDPYECNDIKNVLELFISNRDLRTSLGKLQHEKVKIYDVKKIVDTLEKSYRS